MGQSGSTPRGARGSGGGGSSGGGAVRTATASSHAFAGHAFADIYRDLPSLQADLRAAGLESSNLIVAIDMTKSNTWSGKRSFGGRCLHDIDPTGATLNPYESAITIVGQTLAAFDDDGWIPVYGFGSAGTSDHSVFSLLPRDAPCHTLTGVLARYRELIPYVTLAGPTSFAPIIRRAVDIVRSAGNAYHILVIVCDGQVTRSSDLAADELSPQEADTIAAITEASAFPLSIVVIGVGDGEDDWRLMKSFDDRIPGRHFDNFQFVPFTETLELARRAVGSRFSDPETVRRSMEATFALHALMEVPQQYRAINALRLLGAGAAAAARTIPLYNVRVLEPPPTPSTPIPPAAAAPPRGGPPGLAGGGGGGSTAPLPPTRLAHTMSHRGDFGLGHLTTGADASATSKTASAVRPSAPPAYAALTPDAAAADDPVAPAAAAAAAGAGGAQWACPHCTLVQPLAQAVCVACGSARPAHVAAAVPAAAAAPSAAAVDAHRAEAELAEMREEQQCAVCLERRKNMVFQCGHQTCDVCGGRLTQCPLCRAAIVTRIRMF